jgi:hypothetical protein
MVRHTHRGQVLVEFMLVATAGFLLLIVLTAHHLISWRTTLNAERITKSNSINR